MKISKAEILQKHLHWRQNVENMKIIFVDQNKDFKVAIPLRAVQLAKHSIVGAES